MKTSLWSIVLIGFISGVGIGCTGAKATTDSETDVEAVTGNWEYQVYSSRLFGTGILSIEMDGDKLRGSMQDDGFIELIELEDISFNDQDLSFTARVDQNAPLRITANLSIQGHTLRGNVNIKRTGAFVENVHLEGHRLGKVNGSAAINGLSFHLERNQ